MRPRKKAQQLRLLGTLFALLGRIQALAKNKPLQSSRKLETSPRL